MQDGCHGRGRDGAFHRVLVVDDNEHVAALVADYLQHVDDHVEVTAVTDQSAAVECVRDDDIDCLVTDFHMPGRSGLELVDDVRETDEELPCVVFTSDDRQVLAERAADADVGLVRKRAGPDQLETLASAVDRAIETSPQASD